MRLGDRIEGHLAEAYALARSAVDDPADAEDAVSAAAASLLSGAGRYDPARPFFPYFARAVLNAARTMRRSNARRARREEVVMRQRSGPSGLERLERKEQAAAVRAALAALGPEERTAVLLAHMESLSTTDVAGILGVPRTTASDRVRRGLDKLRAALVRAGFGGLALPGLLAAEGRAPVPARLAGSVRTLTRGQAAAAGGAQAAAPAAASAVKGGFAMKIVAGVVLAGAVAGGVAVVAGGGGAPLAAEKPKFPIPIWHPDARWSAKTEIDVGSGACGQLDGPRRETMSAWAIPARRAIGGPAAGPYGYLSYDPELDRIHFVAGSARGHLDGPFSRARLGSHSYSQVRRGAGSDRYVYCTEPQNKGILRRLDFVEQKVATVSVPAEVKGIAGMTCDSAGRLYIIGQYGGGLQILSPDGKVEKKAVEMKEGTGGFSGLSPVVDEKRNRLYCSGYGSKKWYVYYWDLADGSFHGVLPIPQEGEPRRKRSEAGPFEGTDLYNQMGCSFGPDDPEKRFLYVYPNDTKTIFRLDLEKKEIWACSVGKDGVRFIPSGVPRAFSGWTAYFNMDGDLCTDVPFWNMPRTLRHPRIQ